MHRLVCAVGVAACWGVVVQAGQPVDDFADRVNAVRALVDRDIGAAVPELDRLAAESVARRAGGAFDLDDRDAHRLLFLLRGRAHLQLLNNDLVEDSFRNLLQVDPSFRPQLTPREREILDALRVREGGFLEVRSSEPGATILVNGAEMGVIGPEPLRLTLLAGNYVVRAQKPGFEPVSTQIRVVPNVVFTLETLIPQRIVPPVLFLADQVDLEVRIGRDLVGRTTPVTDARARLAPEPRAVLDRALAQAGLSADRASLFLLSDPPLDTPFMASFSRDCYVDQVNQLLVRTTVLDRLAGREPLLWLGDTSLIRMRPDVGTVQVRSAPSGADVFLDGEFVGVTPIQQDLCAGPHALRLTHRIGTHRAEVEIRGGETEVIEETLRPALAMLGAVEGSAGAWVPSTDPTLRLEQALLASVRGYDLVLAPRPADAAEGTAPEWGDRSTVELISAFDRSDRDEVERLLALATRRFDAPLLLAVRRTGDAPRDPTELLLFWHEHDVPDVVSLPTSQREIRTVVERLDLPTDLADLLYQRSIGVRAIDTGLQRPGLMVVQGDEDDPAGLRLGDVIETVDGLPMTAEQLAARVRQTPVGDDLVLRVWRAGTSSDVALPVRLVPRRGAVFDPRYFGNALVARLTTAGLLTEDSIERELITFHLAQTHMRFRSWERALDLFAGLRGLSANSTVGPGAILLFSALCHQELGRRDNAVALLREATRFADEPVLDDGVSVAAVARRRLVALGEAVVPAF